MSVTQIVMNIIWIICAVIGLSNLSMWVISAIHGIISWLKSKWKQHKNKPTESQPIPQEPIQEPIIRKYSEPLMKDINDCAMTKCLHCGGRIPTLDISLNEYIAECEWLVDHWTKVVEQDNSYIASHGVGSLQNDYDRNKNELAYWKQDLTLAKKAAKERLEDWKASQTQTTGDNK